MKLRSSRGATLLEQAAVLPVILILIFGLVDITTVLMGYNALRSGVDTSLRCVYPTGADCVSIQPRSSERMYRVYDSEVRPEYYGNLYSYSGRASWLERPYVNLQATVLDRVYFTANQPSWSVREPYYRAKGKVNVLVRHFPYLSGEPYGERLTIGGFDGPPARPVVVASGQQLGRIGGILEPNQNEADIGSFTFRVQRPELPEAEKCFKDRYGSTSLENVIAACEDGWHTELTHYTHLVIRVAGTGSAENGTGQVLLSLGQNVSGADPKLGVVAYRELGGRVFGGNGEADLVTRGNDIGYVHDRVKKTYPEEIFSHEGIKALYGRDLTLKFNLSRFGGDRNSEVRWRPTRIEIYTLIFTPHEKDFTCNAPFTEEAISSSTSCETDLGTAYKLEKIGDIPVKTELRSLGCATEKPSMGNLEVVQASAADPSCPRIESSVPCPSINEAFEGHAKNTGVGDPAIDGKVISPAAAIVCPAPNGASEVYWTEKTVNIPDNVPVLKESCENKSPSRELLPASLTKYPKLSFASNVADRHEPFFPADSKADPYKVKDEKYPCPEFKVATREFNNDSSSEESLFKGEKNDLGCEWESVLRKEAEKEGMDPRAFFIGVKEMGRETVLSAKPTSECTTFRQGGKVLDKKLLGTYPESVVDAVCKDVKGVCSTEFMGFQGGEDNAAPTTDVRKAALLYGYPAIEAMYPRAKRECTSKDCVTLTVSEENDGKKLFRATASLNVPLSLLLRKEITITHSSEREWEGNHVTD